MTLPFADTHNMIAYLTKSDASEGLDQIIDFLNASLIKYALTVNPNIYVSCIKQFWSSVSVKKVNDVMRLQALVDRKKVIITKATIREALRLDDVESIDCLPNKEIFTELSKMGYEKPSTKLTFYKAFFSPQWKFLIHIILQCMCVKKMSWNEFSSSMASAVICLSTGRKFNFFKYIFDSLVRNVDSSTKFYMYLRFLQLMIEHRVGKGFSMVDTPLFEGMIVAQQINDVADEGVASVVVNDVLATADEPSIPSPTPTTQPPPQLQKLPSTSQVLPTPPPSPFDQPPSPQQQPQPSHDAEISIDLLHTLLETWGIIANIDADEDVTLKDVAVVVKDVAVVEKTAENEENTDVQGRQAESQAQIYQIDLEHAVKVLSMQDDEVEPAEIQEIMEVVTTAKLMTEVISAASATITAADTPITTATLTTTPSDARIRKGVVIKDPEETATTSIIMHFEPKSKDKGKRIMVEEPKPLRKQAHIEQDEAYARELEAELNKNINWDEVIEQVQRKEKEDNVVMSYDDIRLIFEKYFNSNVAFLEKTKEQLEEEESRALKRKTKSQAEKAAKKQKLDEEVEELKKHLQIVPNDDDDVYT
nr:hypothetical protein [Tanacetum cinerariifolium]